MASEYNLNMAINASNDLLRSNRAQAEAVVALLRQVFREGYAAALNDINEHLQSLRYSGPIS